MIVIQNRLNATHLFQLWICRCVLVLARDFLPSSTTRGAKGHGEEGEARMGALQSFVPGGEGNQQTTEFVRAATVGDVDQLLLMLETGQQVDGADVSVGVQRVTPTE